jgi:8-oxo-dGTP pyrophosphatase MutT (NUDIX family)
MTKYVAGLLFDSDRQKVALILKDHGPAVLLGHWTAIGGKRIDNHDLGLPDESSAAAMWREFQEETGVDIQNWEPFLILRDKAAWQVDFFHAFDTEKLSKVRTMEREIVTVWNLEQLPDILPNLRWIIPMALGHQDDHVWIYEVIEKDTFAPNRNSSR